MRNTKGKLKKKNYKSQLLLAIRSKKMLNLTDGVTKIRAAACPCPLIWAPDGCSQSREMQSTGLVWPIMHPEVKSEGRSPPPCRSHRKQWSYQLLGSSLFQSQATLSNAFLEYLVLFKVRLSSALNGHRGQQPRWLEEPPGMQWLSSHQQEPGPGKVFFFF